MTRPSASGGRRSTPTAKAFALVFGPEVVAYGMALPDGSAIIVRPGTSVLASCTSAHTAARMFAADLIWAGQPACARCGHAGHHSGAGHMTTSERDDSDPPAR